MTGSATREANVRKGSHGDRRGVSADWKSTASLAMSCVALVLGVVVTFSGPQQAVQRPLASPLNEELTFSFRNLQQADSFSNGEDGASTDELTTSNGAAVGAGYALSSTPSASNRESIYLYAGSGSWTTKPELEARSDAKAVAIGDAIYVVGGANEAEETVATVDMYDPLRHTFSEIAELPLPLARYGLAVDNTTIYIAGGRTTGDAAQAGMYSINVGEVEPAWQEETPALPAERSDACLAMANGRMYMIGGYTSDYSILDDILVLDLSDKESGWTDFGLKLPSARGDVSCVSVGSLIYIVGGVSPRDGDWANFAGDSFLDQTLVLNAEAGTLTELAPMRYGRGDVSVVALDNGRLLVTGGERMLRETGVTEIATHDTQMYLPELDLWVAKAPLGTARFRHASAVLRGIPYVIGGHGTCTGGSCSTQDTIEAFFDVDHPDVFLTPTESVALPEAGSTQVVLAAMPEAPEGLRSLGSVFQGRGSWAVPLEDSGRVLLFGGLSTSGTVLDGVWEFDPVSKAFTALEPMPEPRYRYASARLGNSIVLVGGFREFDGGESGEMGGTLVYNISGDSWTTAPAPSQPRVDACAAAVGNLMYVAGGFDSGNDFAILDDVEAFDGSAWAPAAPLPTARGDCGAVELDGGFVVVGGYGPIWDTFPEGFAAAVEKLDPQSGTWEALAPLPNARGDKAVSALSGGRILVVGGETHDGENTQIGTHEVVEYHSSVDTWEARAAIPEARFRATAASVDDWVYVFGGEATRACTTPNDCTDTPADGVWAFHDLDYPDAFMFISA